MQIARWKLTLAALAVAAGTILLPGCGSSGDLGTLVQEQQNNNNGGGGNPLPDGPAPVLTYQVNQQYPHQTDAFTQGLVFSNGRLYESNGLVGESNLRELELTTGDVLREVPNDPAVFAEGLALRGNRLFQLTLSSGIVNVWNQQTFVQETTLPSRNPAWGLAYMADSDRFAFSDGTSTLRYLNANFEEVGSVPVTDNGQPVDLLNELEYVNGVILANRFTTDEIVGIDPPTGVLLFRVNLAGIIDKQAEGLGFNDVLNGIAYDPGQNRIFVTGKRWPFLYEIDILAQ